MPLPVTIATNNFGTPVVDSPNGLPAIVSTMGIPVVIATNGFGVPMNISGAAAPGWTPAELTGLVGWYDAYAGVTQTAGAVSQWNDQSGTGANLVQGTTANQPIYNATSFNGKPGITFDGVNDYLSRVALALGATNKLSCFIAVRRITALANRRWIVYISGAANDYDNAPSCVVFWEPDASSVGGYHGAPRDAWAASTGFFRIGSVYDAANHTLYINNASDGTPVADAGGFGASGNLYVGCGWSGSAVSQFSNITMAEIILTNTGVSATDRNNIEAYLFNKWWGAAGRYLVNKDNGYIVNKDSAYITT